MRLLEVKNLKIHFHTRNGIVRAVDGISYGLDKGATLGVVGESGSGKSVSAFSLLRLLPTPPAKIEEGSAYFDGVDLLSCSADQLRKIRGKRISMIFQDPMTCLNPFLKVEDQLIEPLLIHESLSKEEAGRRAISALKEVGVHDAERRLNQYPHQFSGGMRQRVMIAMALITKPELLIADEPTTALDVTVQAQILELIKKLQQSHGMSVIFITHDLGVIAGLAENTIVMYAGKIVESGKTKDIFREPKHPYTNALLASIPSRHKKGETLYSIPGLPPDPSRPQAGCAFSPRCAYTQDICRSQIPKLETAIPSKQLDNSNTANWPQTSACFRVHELVREQNLHRSEGRM